MVFSGRIGFFQCKECGAEFTSVMPTSIHPMLGSVAISATLWSTVLRRWAPTKLASIPLGIVLALAVFMSSCYTAEYFIRRSRKQCDKCGGMLEATGGGCYDGLVPSMSELAIYAVTILPPYLMLDWLVRR